MRTYQLTVPVPTSITLTKADIALALYQEMGERLGWNNFDDSDAGECLNIRTDGRWTYRACDYPERLLADDVTVVDKHGTVWLRISCSPGTTAIVDAYFVFRNGPLQRIDGAQS